MVKTLPTIERSTKIRFGKHVQEDQGENTIVLNASNTVVDATESGAVYVTPVRFRPDYEGKAEIVLMMYNTNTKELTESGESAQDLIGQQGLQAVTNQGKVTSNSLIFYNNTVAFVTSGNVGIANSLASHTLSVGSNLYVDDKGTNVLVVSGGVGITDTTTSTSATTGALKVAGGISTQKNLNVGGATDASSKTTGALIVNGGLGVAKNIHGKNANFEDVEADSVDITDTTPSNNQTTGALKVAGGLGVAGNVHCGNLTLTGNLTVTGNTTVINANNLIVQDPIIELGKGNASGLDTGIIMNNPLTGGNKGNVAMIYDFSTSNLEIGHTLKGATDSVIVMNTANTLPVNINGTLGVTGTTASSSKTTGAVTIGGGLGVVGDIHATHANLEDVEADSVTITDNTTSTSATTGALKVVGGISTQENLNVGGVAKVISSTDASSKTTGALIVTGGVGISRNIHALNANFEDVEADSVNITDTTTSTSVTTGALKVAGGISTQEKLNVGGITKVWDNTTSSSKTTGAVQVVGGLGISGPIFGSTATFDGDITVTGDLIVSGNTTSQGQNSLTVEDPVIEVGIGNVSGADLGLIMNNPLTGGNKGNVAIIYDFSTSKLEIGHTLKSSADSTITMNTANTLAVNINGTLGVTGTTDASSKTTGALIVTGGLGVAKNIHALHANFEDVEADSVTITDNTTSTSATTGALKVVGGISTQENLNVGAVAKVISGTDASSKTTGALIVTGGVGISKNIHALNANFEDVEADSVNVTDTTVSSSKTTGALIVAGGLGVAANIHTSNIYAGYDADETSYIGRSAIGFMGQSDHASFAHVDNNTTANYALKQSAAGTTHVNAKSGQNVSFKINNAEKARLTSGGDFFVDTDTLYVHAGNDRVGINKAAPAYALDVVGDINFSGTFREDGNPFISTPWTIETSPDALSYTAGNVGIGAADPEANLHVTGNTFISSTTDATTTVTGALIVAGGMGIAKKIVGQHANFEDVEADSVTVTDSTTSTSATTGALKVTGGISTQENLNVGAVAKVISGTDASSKTTGALIVTGGVGISKNIHALHANFEDVEADSVTVTDSTTSTSATTGALKVAGGISTQENLNVGAVAKVISGTDASSKTTGALIVTGGVGISKNIHALHANFEDVEADSVTVTDTTTSTSATTGALKVAGGISTQENLNVGAVAKVISGTDASSKTTGALIVTGGVGISKNIHALHANFEDVEADSVTVTDTTTSTSATTGALKVAGGISTQENLHAGGVAKVHGTTTSSSKTTGSLIVAGGAGVSGPLFGAAATLDGVVTLTNATESTSSTTGALKAAGGVGIAKDVFVGERAYVTGGLVTNTGGFGRKTYSFSTNLAANFSVANATYVLDFTNHPFHAKVTAMLIESDDEISTLIFDVIGGKLGGGSNSAYVPALGQQSIISTSTMNTPWSSTIATALAGTTVTIKPASGGSGTVRFNIFVDYLSHETAGRLSTINTAGTSPDSGDFGY